MQIIVTCDNCFKEIAARWAEERLDGMELSVRDVDSDGGPLGWLSYLKHSPPRPKGSGVDCEEDKAEALLAEKPSKTVPKRWQICGTAEIECKNQKGLAVPLR